MKLHYLSTAVLQAQRLSPSQAEAKARGGWSWHQISPGFTAAGGMANYSRALVSPNGEIAFVSDRANGPTPSGLPKIEIDYTLIRLSVPMQDKDQAKSLGAIWVAHRRIWACAPDRIEDFRRWADSHDPFNLMEA